MKSRGKDRRFPADCAHPLQLGCVVLFLLDAPLEVQHPPGFQLLQGLVRRSHQRARTARGHKLRRWKKEWYFSNKRLYISCLEVACDPEVAPIPHRADNDRDRVLRVVSHHQMAWLGVTCQALSNNTHK